MCRVKAVISELRAEGVEAGSSLLTSLQYAGEVLASLAARTEYVPSCGGLEVRLSQEFGKYQWGCGASLHRM